MQGNSDPGKAAGLAQWADDLVCPVCFAALRFSETTVECTGCARTYPVVDGIPVLIPQRATAK
jgi:uncharacterized protein YbaR (Trm112 family)